VETQENTLQQPVDNANETAADKTTDTGSHFEHVKESMEILYKAFPKAFVKDGDCKPLKIGIFDELKERASSIEGLSVSKLRAALRLYTSRLKYLYSVKEGAARIDLDGNESGDSVNAEHAQYAQEKIKEINQKRKAQKPAKKPAQNKKFFKKNGPKPARKPFKIEGEKATVEDLKNGTEVIVLSSEQHFVKGVVAQDAAKDTVYVTLKSGLTVNLPLDRVLLPKKAK